MVANAGVIVYESFQTSKSKSFFHCTSLLRATKVTVESFDRVMAVNARGTMLSYKHAGKQMIAQGRGGRIIGTHPTNFLFEIHIDRGYTRGMLVIGKTGSSLPFALLRTEAHVVQTASPIIPSYSASKSAIRGLTQAAGTFFT